MTAYELSCYAAAAIMVYKACQNLVMYFASGRIPSLVPLAMTELATAGYISCFAGTINTPNRDMAFVLERMENFFLPVMGAFFMRFIHRFRPIFSERVSQGVVAWYVLIAVAILVDPRYYRADLDFSKSFPSLGITVYETHQPPWIWLFVGTAIFTHARIYIKYFVDDLLYRVWPLLIISFTVFCALAINDSLVALGTWHFPYLSHFSCLLLVFTFESLYRVVAPSRNPAEEPQRLPQAGGSPLPDIAYPSGGFLIRAFGSLDIETDNMKIPYALLAGKKQLLQVLKILVIRAQKGIHREELMEILWRGEKTHSAVNKLHVLIFRLRKMIGQHLVHFADEKLALDYRIIRTDFQIFDDLVKSGLAAMRKGDTDDGIRSLEKAVEIYRGDFFEFDPYYDEATVLREYFRGRFKEAAYALCEAAKTDEDGPRLTRYSSQAMRKDGLDEVAFRYHMQGLSLSGNRSEALRKFGNWRRELKQEMDAEPDPRTMELIRQLRSEKGA